jgi:hypothetical protein
MKTVSMFKKTNVWPEQRVESPQRAVLSVLDSSVARYSPASGIWLYSADSTYLTFDRLTTSLVRTLAHYPQLCGQLEWADKPLGKLALRWGSESDPGVVVAHARCSTSLAEEFPSYEQRVKRREWTTDQPAFLSAAEGHPLALHSGIFGDWTGMTSCIVQLTQFSCGGFAVSLKCAHVLADAQNLGAFMRIWSLYNQNLNATIPEAYLPVFQPELLDQQADSIDGKAPEIVDALPMMRWDLWSSDTSTAPSYMADHLKPPSHCLPLQRAPGTPIPWESLNGLLPCESRYLHFDQAEILACWQEATLKVNEGLTTITKLDALLAKIWNAILLAKKQTVFKLGPTDVSPVPVNFQIGSIINTRPRLEPKLPETFFGSPTVVMNVSRSINDDLSSTADTATLVRSNVSQFTPTAMKALLHEMQQYESPSRYWNCYLGNTCSIFTSWVRQGSYDNQFVPGVAPYFVEPLMPRVDGIIQITESGPALGASSSDPSSSSKNASDWTQPGATVYLSLEKEAFALVMKILGRSTN